MSSEAGPAEIEVAAPGRYYPALNGLRAVAVIAVFFEHYITHDDRFPAWKWGWTGVQLFFVLSGFLITGILFDSREHTFRFRNFYARRALRIFPLYYAVILFAVCLYPIFHWKLYPQWIFLPLYLFNYIRFVSVDQWMHAGGALDHLLSTRPYFGAHTLILGHFWSLSVEEQFYLVWPLIIFTIKDRVRLRNICFFGVALIPLLRVACLHLLPASFLTAQVFYRGTPFCADSLLLGGMLALMQRGPEIRVLQRWLWPAFYCFTGFIVLFLCIYRLHAHHAFYSGVTGKINSTIGFTLIDFYCAILITMALEPGTRYFRFLCARPLFLLGQISYGFYLFHDLFHSELIKYERQFFRLSPNYELVVVALIGFLLTLTLATLSYRYFESPLLKLKTRFQ